MIKVRKMSGNWIVTMFVKEHTYPLTPGNGRQESRFNIINICQFCLPVVCLLVIISFVFLKISYFLKWLCLDFAKHFSLNMTIVVYNAGF